MITTSRYPGSFISSPLAFLLFSGFALLVFVNAFVDLISSLISFVLFVVVWCLVKEEENRPMWLSD